MKLTNLLFIIIFPLLLISCGEQSRDGNLIVGTAADNPNYEFIQEGQIVGFDIDLINAIGEKLGKKIIIKNFDFNGLLAALAGKNIDMVIAGLSVTEERKNHVSFSNSYLSTKLSVLHRKSDNFTSSKDLDNKIIGVQLGTTWAIIAQDLSKQINIKINYLSNNLMLVEELKSNVVDAVIVETSQSRKFIENNQELTSFDLPAFSSEFAIALPKNSELVNNVNKAITELTKDGTINNLTKKWLQR